MLVIMFEWWPNSSVADDKPTLLNDQAYSEATRVLWDRPIVGTIKQNV